jgi:ELWxxDGT repeat protein
VAGTQLVRDFSPGLGYPTPGGLTNVNGTLFFSANDGTNGSELWRSDGTAGGTVQVKDIVGGSTGSYPSQITNVNGTGLFRVDDGTHGLPREAPFDAIIVAAGAETMPDACAAPSDPRKIAKASCRAVASSRQDCKCSHPSP